MTTQRKTTMKAEDLGKKIPFKVWYVCAWNENAQCFFGLPKLNSKTEKEADENAEALFKRTGQPVRILLNDNGKQSIYKIIK